jgi:type I restriction enzyme S subunit
MRNSVRQWTSLLLSEIAEIERTAVSPENIKSGTLYVGLENITSSGTFVGVSEVASGDLASTKFAFTDKHILYGKLRPYLAKIAFPQFSGVCSTDILPILPGPKVDRRFLLHFLRQPRMVDFASSQTAGANLPRLSPKALAEFEIPLPPLSEQKRIADILDKADAIRRKRQEALQLNGDVIYSVYQEQFGNPIANPNGFPTRKIDDMCNLVRGSSPRPKSDPRYYGGPIRRLMVEDITRDGRLVTPQIDSLTEEGAKKSRPCTAGTVVMVVSGNVGLPAKLAVDACIHDGFVGLQDLDTSVIRPDFLVLTLEMLKVTHERFKAGAIWQNLTTHQIKAMEIPLPPLDEQDDFDQFVARHNQFTTVLKAKASEEDRLFNSLVQRAFKGEL